MGHFHLFFHCSGHLCPVLTVDQFIDRLITFLIGQVGNFEVVLKKLRLIVCHSLRLHTDFKLE
jgi:hypothetical protein